MLKVESAAESTVPLPLLAEAGAEVSGWCQGVSESFGKLSMLSVGFSISV